MNYLRQFFTKNYLPRWLILIFDLAVIVFSWFLAFLLRFNFDLSAMETYFRPVSFAIILPVVILCFWKSRSYSGILRHSTIEDVIRISFAILTTNAILVTISLVGRRLNAPTFVVMPVSVLLIFAGLVSSILILSRVIARIIYQHLFYFNKNYKRVMIFGAGQLGQTTLNALLMDFTTNSKVIGFIDDNSSLQNKSVSGVPIYSEYKAFNSIIPKNKIDEVIVAIDNSKISLKRKKEIANKCINHQVIVKEVPPVKTWIKGELETKAIRSIRIEDLLERDSIQLDRKKIELGLKNSVVLVTGAAGSIGSEIIRQLISFNVQKIVLLDNAESDLFNLQQEILSKKGPADFEVIVGDVTNKTKLRQIFKKHNPTFVFNAAAYKHVPLMEEFPCEAVRVNIGGTKIVVDLAIEFGVQKFVFISTDKAVNPTNVMGVTKRISEIYIQALAHSGKYSTQFITTRFGNVLGSNGSVIPTFKKQIKKGGPLTITHKEITRYFMTIPEACQLVLEAGFMGNGGEIFVFDMGEPIKIIDLAKKMISLSGFVPNKDIKIEITGLRPGEKLYEELLTDKEKLLDTHNKKIMIGEDKKHDLSRVSYKINELIENLDIKSKYTLVKQMMKIVPEFIPSNSKYNNGKNQQSLEKQKNKSNYKSIPPTWHLNRTISVGKRKNI